MTGVERKHQCLMAIYGFGVVVAASMAWFPSFLCRAGSAVLLVGLIHMIWQRRCALHKGLEELARLCSSLLHYAPFLVGTNLIWMGLPLPLDGVAKASVDLLFLAGTIGLLSVLYVYNNRAAKCVVR